jgi:hypothetical protein
MAVAVSEPARLACAVGAGAGRGDVTGRREGTVARK